MALHKLLVDDFYDETYMLFAIHCRLEDYRLAYLLNQRLNLNLKRKSKDLDLNYSASSYALFEWNNKADGVLWNLIANVYKKEEKGRLINNGLFSENSTVIKTYNFIPELSQVDYFIKISNEIQHINQKIIIDKLQSIPHIVTSYSIDLSQIKSKEHLIF